MELLLLLYMGYRILPSAVVLRGLLKSFRLSYNMWEIISKVKPLRAMTIIDHLREIIPRLANIMSATAFLQLLTEWS